VLQQKQPECSNSSNFYTPTARKEDLIMDTIKALISDTQGILL